jgi:DNA-binding CsgD family transcriptional regulator
LLNLPTKTSFIFPPHFHHISTTVPQFFGVPSLCLPYQTNQKVSMKIIINRETEISPAEQEVLRHLAQCKINKQIAADLGLSEHTVKSHLKTISIKTGLDGRLALALFAIEHGLADCPVKECPNNKK